MPGGGGLIHLLFNSTDFRYYHSITENDQKCINFVSILYRVFGDFESQTVAAIGIGPLFDVWNYIAHQKLLRLDWLLV